jgi:thiamine kinase-like enzyme
MPSAPEFPLTLADLDVTWLNRILCPPGETLAITDFRTEVIGIGQGFMADLARLYLDHNHAALPSQLIIKFASHYEATRLLAARMNYYGRELGFYDDCANSAGVRVPKIYHQSFDPTSQHFVMLMEDLHPSEPTDQITGNSLEESKAVMLAFADLHGRWWNDPQLKQLSWTAPTTHVQPIAESLKLLNESIEEASVTGRFDRYPCIKHLQPLLPPLFAMEPPPPEPFTLVHGDLRSDNIFFSPGPEASVLPQPIIIDWQTAGIGQPMVDITRWLTQSVSIELRQAHEQTLLKVYHDRLIENGVKGYSFKKMRQEYELNLIVMLLMFSMSMNEIDQSSDRAEALFHAMYSRLDAALADWQVEKTLKILPLMIPFMKVGVWFKSKFKGLSS